MSGNSRNFPCPCLSGKHWKGCHPELDDSYQPPIFKKGDGPEVLENHIIKWMRDHGYVTGLTRADFVNLVKTAMEIHGLVYSLIEAEKLVLNEQVKINGRVVKFLDEGWIDLHPGDRLLIGEKELLLRNNPR